jgi:oxygen-independent coproporphyrinogen-3 oxidase
MQNNLGLYVHIPFCTQKCAYCAFVSHRSGKQTIQNYFDALLKEVELTSKQYQKKQVDTIYIGGGTPSYVQSEHITKLLNHIKTHFNVLQSAEITIECNPESTTTQKLQAYKEVGVNRLSVGLQSTNDRLLKLLNRAHDSKQFFEVIKQAKQVGFTNISADLILSLPTQKMRDLKRSLKQLKKCNLTHLSVYDLILEEDTPFAHQIKIGKLKQVSEKLSLKMQHYTTNYLTKQGFNRYEVSAFCKTGYESKHNIKYWNLDDYLGLGLAAHSKIGATRFANASSLKTYLNHLKNNKLAYESKITLTKQDQKEEFIMLSLRKKEGICLKEYETLFSENLLTKKEQVIKQLKNERLIEVKDNLLYATNKGFDVLNLLIAKLV